MKHSILTLTVILIGIGYFSRSSSPVELEEAQETPTNSKVSREFDLEQPISDLKETSVPDTYFEKLQDKHIAELMKEPLVLEYTFGEALDLTEGEILAHEKHRVVNFRRRMIVDINGGYEPTLTEDDKEIISQLFRDEGLEPINN